MTDFIRRAMRRKAPATGSNARRAAMRISWQWVPWDTVVTDQNRAVLVIGDMLAAAADDLDVRLTTRDARRLAPRIIELLALAGYEISRPEPEPDAAEWTAF